MTRMSCMASTRGTAIRDAGTIWVSHHARSINTKANLCSNTDTHRTHKNCPTHNKNTTKTKKRKSFFCVVVIVFVFFKMKILKENEKGDFEGVKIRSSKKKNKNKNRIYK
eukprot:PhF_6_TR6197/c1_g1_i1/m.9313